MDMNLSFSVLTANIISIVFFRNNRFLLTFHFDAFPDTFFCVSKIYVNVKFGELDRIDSKYL